MGFLGANNEVAINITQKLVVTADTSQQWPPRLCSQLMIEAQCLRMHAPKCRHLAIPQSRQVCRFSIWTVQNSLDNVDADMPLAQDRSLHGMHSASLWSAFLASAHQGRALEQQNTQLHKYTLPLLEIYQKPPKQGHVFTSDTLDGTNAVLIIEVPSIYILTNVI